MCRGADHTVIQCKTQAALGRQVGINDVGLGTVGMSQQGKQRVRLCSEIVARADGK